MIRDYLFGLELLRIVIRSIINFFFSVCISLINFFEVKLLQWTIVYFLFLVVVETLSLIKIHLNLLTCRILILLSMLVFLEKTIVVFCTLIPFYRRRLTILIQINCTVYLFLWTWWRIIVHYNFLWLQTSKTYICKLWLTVFRLKTWWTTNCKFWIYTCRCFRYLVTILVVLFFIRDLSWLKWQLFVWIFFDYLGSDTSVTFREICQDIHWIQVMVNCIMGDVVLIDAGELFFLLSIASTIQPVVGIQKCLTGRWHSSHFKLKN